MQKLINKMSEITKEAFEQNYAEENDVKAFIDDYKKYDLVNQELNGFEYNKSRVLFYKENNEKDIALICAKNIFKIENELKELDGLIKLEDDDVKCIKLINKYNLMHEEFINYENRLYLMQLNNEIKKFDF